MFSKTGITNSSNGSLMLDNERVEMSLVRASPNNHIIREIWIDKRVVIIKSCLERDIITNFEKNTRVLRYFIDHMVYMYSKGHVFIKVNTKVLT